MAAPDMSTNMETEIKTNLPPEPSKYEKKTALVQPLAEGVEAGTGQVVLVANDGNRFPVRAETLKHYARSISNLVEDGKVDFKGVRQATLDNVQLFCTWLKRRETVHHSKQPLPMPMPWYLDSLYSDNWDIAFIRQHLLVVESESPSVSASQKVGRFQKMMDLAFFTDYAQCRPLMEMLCTFLCWEVKILLGKPDAVAVVRGWFKGQKMTEEQMGAIQAWLQKTLREKLPPVRRSMLDPDEFDDPPLTDRDDSITKNSTTISSPVCEDDVASTITTTTGGTPDHLGGASTALTALDVNNTAATTTTSLLSKKTGFDGPASTASPLLPLQSSQGKDAPTKVSLIRFPISSKKTDDEDGTLATTEADDWIRFLPANYEFLCQLILMGGHDGEGNLTFPVPLAVNLIQNLYEPVFECHGTAPGSKEAAKAGNLGLLYSFLTLDRIHQIEEEGDERNFEDGLELKDRPPLFLFMYNCFHTQPDASDLLLQYIQSTGDDSIWKKTAARVLGDVCSGQKKLFGRWYPVVEASASNCLLQLHGLIKKYDTEVIPSADAPSEKILAFEPESSVARHWCDPLHLQDLCTDPAEWSLINQPVESAVEFNRLHLFEAGTLRDLPFISPSLFQSLRTVQISKCPNMKCLQGLAGCQSLTTLFLTSLPALTNGGLPKLVSLKCLEICDCPQITNLEFLSSLSSLTQLWLTNLPELTDEGLPRDGQLVSLEDLRVGDCPQITKLEFLSSLSSLKELGLENQPELKEEGLLVNGELVSLSGLEIRNCPRVTNLMKFFSSVKVSELDHLQLDGLPNLTDEGLPSLRLEWFGEVEIRNCPRITKLEFLSSVRKLDSLSVDTASPEFDFSAIGSFQSLRYLFINAPIDNLNHFLHGGMTQLEEVHFNNDVERVLVEDCKPLGPEALYHLGCLPRGCRIFNGLECSGLSPADCEAALEKKRASFSGMKRSHQGEEDDAEGDDMVLLVSSSSTTTGGGGGGGGGVEGDDQNTNRRRHE